MKSFVSLFLLVVSLFYSGCGEEKNNDSNSTEVSTEIPVSEETILSLAIPAREIGYDHFDTTVIETNETLTTFLTNLDLQEHWNDKSGFFDVFNTPIDFNRYRLILFRVTESSGSIVVTPQQAVLVNDIPLIHITEESPEIVTDDMAYYCFAYLVDKEYTEVDFEVGSRQVVSLKF